MEKNVSPCLPFLAVVEWRLPDGEPGLGKDGPSGTDRGKVLSIPQRKNEP